MITEFAEIDVKCKIKKTYVRLEFTTYWSEVSHHNHHTKKPHVSGTQKSFQSSLTGSSCILVVYNLKETGKTIKEYK